MFKLKLKTKNDKVNETPCSSSLPYMETLEPLSAIIGQEEINIKSAVLSTNKALELLDSKNAEDTLEEQELVLLNGYITHAQESLNLPKNIIKYNITDVAEESIIGTIKSIIDKIIEVIGKIITWFKNLFKSFIDWIKSLFSSEKEKKEQIDALEHKSVELKDSLITKLLILGDEGNKINNLLKKGIVTEDAVKGVLNDILNKSNLETDAKNKKLDEYINKFKENINDALKLTLYLNVTELKDYIIDKNKGVIEPSILTDVFATLNPNNVNTDYINLLSSIETLLKENKDIFKLENFDNSSVTKFFNNIFVNSELKTTYLTSFVKNDSIIKLVPTIKKQGILLFTLTKLNYKNKKINFDYSYSIVEPKKAKITNADIAKSNNFNSLVNITEYTGDKESKNTLDCNLESVFNFFTFQMAENTNSAKIDFSKIFGEITTYGDKIISEAEEYNKKLEGIKKNIENIESPETKNLIKNSFFIFSGTFQQLTSKAVKEIAVIKRFANTPIEFCDDLAKLKHKSLQAQVDIVNDLISIIKKKEG